MSSKRICFSVNNVIDRDLYDFFTHCEKPPKSVLDLCRNDHSITAQLNTLEKNYPLIFQKIGDLPNEAKLLQVFNLLEVALLNQNMNVETNNTVVSGESTLEITSDDDSSLNSFFDAADEALLSTDQDDH